MDDVTPSTSTPEVEEVAVAEPSAPPVADPPPAVEEPTPSSWREVEDRVAASDPELAKTIGRLRGEASNAIGEARRAAREPVKLDEILLATFQRRVAGLEEGDPYEGIEIQEAAAPDFAAVVGEVPDEALTDKAALKAYLIDAFGKAHAASAEAAKRITFNTIEATSRASYKPLVEKYQAAERTQAAATAAEQLRRLPGMADPTAFDAVYAQMEARDLYGVDGFRAAYAEMLEKHPEWVAPKAAPAPEVIVRPPPPKAQPSPLDVARQASQFFSPKRQNGTPNGTLIPPGATQAEREAIIGKSPEFNTLFAGDDDEPQHVRFRRMKASMGT